MTDWERGLDPSQEWQDLMDAIEAAAKDPSPATFGLVATAALKWSSARSHTLRGSTSSSAPDLVLYKEKDALTESRPPVEEDRLRIEGEQGGYEDVRRWVDEHEGQADGD